MIRRFVTTLTLFALCASSALAAQTSLRCVRSLPTAAKPGDVIGVALSTRIPEGITMPLEVAEVPPEGWEITSVSPGGSWDGETINWRILSSPGAPVVMSYAAALPPNASGVGVFHGTAAIPAASVTCTVDGAETVPIGSSFNVGGFDLNAWELIGLLGTLVFASRFILQWIASERAGKSVVPEAFWWISLLGTTILTLYGIHFRRMAVVVGQASGFAVYIRNLMLIHQHKKRRDSPAG